MRLLGALLILAAGGWGYIGQVRRLRRQLQLLGELVDALGSMEGAIRFQRLPLPQVLQQQTARPLAGPYFRGVLQQMRGGLSMQEAWERTFDAWEDRETAQALARVEWSGDETQLLGNLQYARQTLARYWDRRSTARRERERLLLAAALSSAGLLVILLI